MGYSINNIVKLKVLLSQQGVGVSNFALPLLVCKTEDAISDQKDKMLHFTNLSDLKALYEETSETYKAASAFLDGIPTSKGIYIWNPDTDNSTDPVFLLNKAREKAWWFFTFFTADVYENLTHVKAIADWAEENRSYFANCQSKEENVNGIRDISKTDDIASELTTSNYRYTRTLANKESPYAAITETKWFASVNYDINLSTITGEYKPLSKVTPEDLATAEISAMKNKNTGFYSKLDLQGSTTDGKVINSKTHSGAFIDDVINIEAFTNALKVALSNAITQQPAKLPQTPQGQQILIDAVTFVGEKYISNGFLGSRSYIDPVTGKEKITRGYEISTVAEDILNIPDSARNNREGAPISMTIFTSGAIHEISMTTDVF